MAIETAEHTPGPIDVSIASRPSDMKAAPGLARDIVRDIDGLATGTDEDRKTVLNKCRSLMRALETPRETMVGHGWGQVTVIAAICFCVDIGLWKLMAQNGDKSQKAADLAVSLGVDPALLRRVMRHIGAMQLMDEVGEDEYKPNNYTKALSLPEIGHPYLVLTSCASSGILRFHEFSRETRWVNPTDSKDTSLKHATGKDMNLFALAQHMGYGVYMNDYLSGYTLGCPLWIDEEVYPVRERLIAGADSNPEAPFLVDIGGNVGHDMARFLRRFPDVPGKLFVQDLPVVIGQIKNLDPVILRMGYDFHTEQPVKGARAYYMHSTLHNWPDHVCDNILAQVKAAMKPEYSKLLINEFVLPETGSYWETTGVDMITLTLFCSEQRTRQAWYNLLENRAGLKIVKIWDGGKGVQSLIECELP